MHHDHRNSFKFPCLHRNSARQISVNSHCPNYLVFVIFVRRAWIKSSFVSSNHNSHRPLHSLQLNRSSVSVHSRMEHRHRSRTLQHLTFKNLPPIRLCPRCLTWHRQSPPTLHSCAKSNLIPAPKRLHCRLRPVHNAFSLPNIARHAIFVVRVRTRSQLRRPLNIRTLLCKWSPACTRAHPYSSTSRMKCHEQNKNISAYPSCFHSSEGGKHDQVKRSDAKTISQPEDLFTVAEEERVLQSVLSSERWFVKIDCRSDDSTWCSHRRRKDWIRQSLWSRERNPVWDKSSLFQFDQYASAIFRMQKYHRFSMRTDMSCVRQCANILLLNVFHCFIDVVHLG